MGNKQSKKDAGTTKVVPISKAHCGGKGSGTEEDDTKGGMLMTKLDIPIDNYGYPFENVVFEGAGAKVLALVGAVRTLEEAGVWSRVRRVAGAGSGALVAALAAVGYNSYQLERLLATDLNTLMLDHCCGCCSLMPGLLRRFGWGSGTRLHRWLGDRLRDNTKQPDITFLQVYRQFGRELCITVANVNQGGLEYCHPKTTPDMPVRVALHMALTVPGLMQPVPYTLAGHQDLFVDGSAICNLPLHVYDGWWLSMHPSDSFLERLNPLTDLPRHLHPADRFSGDVDKTIGVCMFAEHEQDPLEAQVEARNGYPDSGATPDTNLARRREACREQRGEALDHHTELAMALDALLKVMTDHNLDKSKGISRNDLQNILNKEEVTKGDVRVLFGDGANSDSIFKDMEQEKADQVPLHDIVQFVDRRGLGSAVRYTAHRRRHTPDLTAYCLALRDTCRAASKVLSKEDCERVVGINTHHVGSADYSLQPEDRRFLVEQGKQCTREFLEYYVMKKLPAVSEEDARKSFQRDDLSSYMDDELSEIIDHKDYMEDLSIIGLKL